MQTYRAFQIAGAAVAILFLVAGPSLGQGVGGGDGDPNNADDPQWISLTLTDKSVISGLLTIDHLTVDTRFGRLEVPIEAIRSFTPGLDNHPEFDTRLRDLIEKLAADNQVERDAVQRELVALGPSIRKFLERYLNDEDPERKLRVEAILAEFDEMLDEEDEDFPRKPSLLSMARLDTVETADFTIVGSISPKQFTLKSRYGTLTVKLGDIQYARRRFEQVQQEVRKRLEVDGTNLLGRKFRGSRVRIERGQKVVIKASGTINLTPWGRNAVSPPDGAANYGSFSHSGLQLVNGQLVARVGKSGNVFKVGSSHKFTAKRAGALQFAIAIHPGQTNQTFAGSYKVVLRVLPSK